MEPKRLLSTKEAAERYSLSQVWFAHCRMNNEGPPYMKVKGRVLYPTKETDEWFMSHYVKTGEQTNDE